MAEFSASRPRVRKVYSAPRRFDLATLFVVTILYSLLFGILTACEFEPRLIVSVAVFLSAIGISQAALFQGQMPRLASVIVGGIAWSTLVGIVGWSSVDFVDEYVLMIVINLFPGLFVGYLCGTLVGGVFLIADHLRQGRGKLD